MDWLKKNPAQVVLAVVALGVLTILVLLMGKVKSFPDQFIYSAPPQNNKVEKIDSAPLTKAAADFSKPPLWVPQTIDNSEGVTPGSLFVSDVYLLKDSKLIKLDGKGAPLQPPISNEWLMNYGLELTSATVQAEDKDDDGFSNLDEWLGQDGLSHLDTLGQPVADAAGKPLPDDSSDPTDANSHPPYVSKLTLAGIRKIPFRMVFKSWDGDPAKPEEMSFQMNTLDFNQPTIFPKLGEAIPNSKFKLKSFEKKTQKNVALDTEDDVSELTVVHTETGKPVVLVLGQIKDSPDSNAIFSYKWVKTGVPPTGNFQVKSGQEFGLQPETDKKYKLIDIKDTEVQIQTPTGEKKTLRQTQIAR